MTLRLFISIFAIAFWFTTGFNSCKEPESKSVQKSLVNASSKGILYDTSLTAIIPFNPKGIFPFSNSCKPEMLLQEDIRSIDSILIASVVEFNKALDSNFKFLTIDLKKHNYRKQLVAVINDKGEREVWVNCFCNTWNNNWKIEILFVDDGGSCYFNFKIDLTTKRYSAFRVNGEA
jgi:hypothetical protein